MVCLFTKTAGAVTNATSFLEKVNQHMVKKPGSILLRNVSASSASTASVVIKPALPGMPDWRRFLILTCSKAASRCCEGIFATCNENQTGATITLLIMSSVINR